MRRSPLLLLSIVAALGLITTAILALRRESPATPPPIDEPAPSSGTAPATRSSSVPSRTGEPEGREGPTPEDIGPRPAMRAVDELPPAAADPYGTIAVSLELTEEQLERFRSVTLVFREAREPRADGTGAAAPRTWMRPVKLLSSEPTLRFVEERVPFCDEGYLVSAFLPGFDGGEVHVACNATHPRGEVRLTAEPGSIARLRLVDPSGNPLSGERVRLRPTGRPEGRAQRDAVSDVLGLVVFEGLPRGTWEIVVDDVVQERVVAPQAGLEPREVVLRRGQTLSVEVLDPAGHGLADLQVEAEAIGVALAEPRRARSDAAGRAEIVNLAPGRWLVRARSAGHRGGEEIVVIGSDGPPPLVRLRLTPLR